MLESETWQKILKYKSKEEDFGSIKEKNVLFLIIKIIFINYFYC